MSAADLPPSLEALRRLQNGFERMNKIVFDEAGNPADVFVSTRAFIEFNADPFGYVVSPERTPERARGLIELAWKLGRVQ